SSRRRHTRWPRDWSSDVCSSDLWLDGIQDQDFSADEPRLGRVTQVVDILLQEEDSQTREELKDTAEKRLAKGLDRPASKVWLPRSEERRVGKECGSGGARGDERK